MCTDISSVIQDIFHDHIRLRILGHYRFMVFDIWRKRIAVVEDYRFFRILPDLRKFRLVKFNFACHRKYVTYSKFILEA